jgi:hypothetical protein
MLGDKVGELRGKVTGRRVLPPDGPAPKVETSFEIAGALLGIEATMLGTYWSTIRPDGTLYGECPQQGLVMTAGGDLGPWSGAGVGRFVDPGGAVNFRGAIYFHGATGALACLNEVAVLYEWEIDAQGNGQAAFWEWT